MRRRYSESTPLADRDALQAWQKEYDAKEARSSKEKFGSKLRDRNKEIYEGWYTLMSTIQNRAFHEDVIDSEGFDDFLNREDPYLCPTGHFNSLSFSTNGFDLGSFAEHRVGGLGIGIWYHPGDEAGGDVYEEFIPKLKKAGGADILIFAASPLFEDSNLTYGMKSEKQQLNLYTKSLLGNGFTRSEVSGVIKAYQDFIDGNTEEYAPGANGEVLYSGLEEERPCVFASYNNVPVNPLDDEDMFWNIVACAERFYDTFVGPFL